MSTRAPSYVVIHTDARAWLAARATDSVDAVVCDPPYELGFMGRKWDASGIAYDVELWRGVLRVLKPGGYLLAFGGTRTYHRMACAIEDSGFEIRDCLQWLYGSGFPKSLNVSKSIDKAAGAVREVVGHWKPTGTARPNKGAAGHTAARTSGADPNYDPDDERQIPITAPATDAAKQWSGWGTALKPACEPIVMARKPFKGTIAANVQARGVGAINVDGCRVGDRWPPNVLLDDDAAEMLDDDSGERPAGNVPAVTGSRVVLGGLAGHASEPRSMGDDGGASRYFPRFRYEPKASTAEREAGCYDLPLHTAGELTRRQDGSAGLKSPRAGAGRVSSGRRNTHATVKPVELMRWLVRLVTPPAGLVLDPFAGSGTTGCACIMEGASFIGLELLAEHATIARARMAEAERRPSQPLGSARPELVDPRQLSLLDMMEADDG